MANFNFNKVILGGRLTSDPVLKTTASGVTTTSFTLAVNRVNKDKNGNTVTDFISCVAWRQNAEFITKYYHKGSCICIVGSMQVRDWTDKDGNKRYTTEVVIEERFFVDSKGDSNIASAPVPLEPDIPQDAHLEAIGEDEDLPF